MINNSDLSRIESGPRGILNGPIIKILSGPLDDNSKMTFFRHFFIKFDFLEYLLHQVVYFVGNNTRKGGL